MGRGKTDEPSHAGFIRATVEVRSDVTSHPAFGVFGQALVRANAPPVAPRVWNYAAAMAVSVVPTAFCAIAMGRRSVIDRFDRPTPLFNLYEQRPTICQHHLQAGTATMRELIPPPFIAWPRPGPPQDRDPASCRVIESHH